MVGGVKFGLVRATVMVLCFRDGWFACTPKSRSTRLRKNGIWSRDTVARKLITILS